MKAHVDRPRTPWHLWAVAALGLVWNGFGVYNYLMTKVSGETYLRSAGMTDAQLAYINTAPAWTTAVWAIGVWGALLGTLLLLLRNRLAVPVFALSLAGFLAGLAYPYFLAEDGQVMTEDATGLNLTIFAGCLFCLLYAISMTRRRVLQ